MTSTSNNPVLAIACGPIVTTWDISKQLQSNDFDSSTSELSSIDATSILCPSSSSTFTNRNGVTSSSSRLSSLGVEQFQPYRYGLDGCTIKDVVWNHNGQVLATCSNINFSSPSIQRIKRSSSQINNNIALTLNSSQTTLECFPNNTSPSKFYQTTSISFGGSNAKSRYICVSDDGGYISVWDMKKRPVKRVRCFKLQCKDENENKNNDELVVGCSKACMDPSDTFVIGLHGERSSSGYTSDNYVTLDLFHLKTGNIATTLQDDGTHGGASNCFHFSHLDPNQLLVGTKNGSLLLWDISSSVSASSTTSTTSKSIHSPIITLESKHQNHVTDVAFSPMNKVLAASCSLDGYVMFHDVQSKKVIQTLKPSLPSSYSSGRLVSDIDIDNGGLTSLAFDSNGYTWAVGTNHGHVLNYDLRQISAGPLSTLNVGDVANNGGDGGSDQNQHEFYPVNRLQFAPAPSSSSTVKGVKSAKKKQNLTASKLSNQVLKQEESQTIHTEKQNARVNGTTILDESQIDTAKNFDSPKPSTTISTELFQSGITNNSPDDTLTKSTNLNENTDPQRSQMSYLKSPTNTTTHGISVVNGNYESPKEGESELTKNMKAEEGSDVTDSIISSFDKMYERLKNRETYSPPEKESARFETQNESEKSTTASTPAPVETKSFESMKSRYFDSNGSDDGDVFTLTKKQIEEIVDDAVESLRDDMDDALQSLQCTFMRQLQRQADETRELFEQQRRDMEKLLKENELLKQRNNANRLF